MKIYNKTLLKVFAKLNFFKQVEIKKYNYDLLHRILKKKREDELKLEQLEILDLELDVLIDIIVKDSGNYDYDELKSIYKSIIEKERN